MKETVKMVECRLCDKEIDDPDEYDELGYTKHYCPICGNALHEACAKWNTVCSRYYCEMEFNRYR